MLRVRMEYRNFLHVARFVKELVMERWAILRAWSRYKEQQLQAYVNWVNSQLKKRQGCRMVEDLRRDMQDGVALIHLVEIVSGESLARVELSPTTSSAMRENIERVLQFMASKKIRMHHTSAKDIVDGNLKAIMRLILALAAHYKPGSVKQSPAATAGTPGRKPATRQPSFAANLASAQAAIQDARKEAAGTSSLRRYKEQRHLHGLPPQSPSSGGSSHRRRGSSRDVADGDGHGKSSRQTSSPVPSILTTSPSPSPIPSPALLTGRHRAGSPRLSHTGQTSDSDQGSAAEDSGSRSSSRRSSVAYTNDLLIEEQIEMTRELEETKRVISQLQELLLSGRLPDDDVNSEAEEDQIPFEGSNAKEQLVVFQARLSQRQEECNQLRNEVSKVKQECRNLQGTKAGLQSRLTEQDNALLQMKAELLRVGFTQQNLEAEKSESNRKIEEKDRILSDLRGQMSQKDKLLKQQQEQIETLTEQLQDLNSFKTQLQNQLENKGSTTTQVLESQIEELSQRLEGVGMAEANLATHISAQDRKLTRIEGKVQSGIRIPTPFKEGSDELATLRSTLRTLRTNMSSHDPNHHALDSLEQGMSALIEQINPSYKGILRRDSDSSSTESSVRHSSYDNQRRSPMDHRHDRASTPSSNYGHSVHNSYSPTPNGSASCTKVLYFTERAVTPFMTSIPKQLGEVTLRDFKQIFDRDGNYRYHFKALDPEFGTVKEEVIDDDDILPGWEGKIVGWIEEDTG